MLKRRPLRNLILSGSLLTVKERFQSLIKYIRKYKKYKEFPRKRIRRITFIAKLKERSLIKAEWKKKCYFL